MNATRLPVEERWQREQAVERFRTEVLNGKEAVVVTGPDGNPVLLAEFLPRKLAGKDREWMFGMIRPTIEEADEIWLAAYETPDGRYGTFRMHYIKYFQSESGEATGMASVVETHRGTPRSITTIPLRKAKDVEKRRAGVLVWKKWGGRPGLSPGG